ncbi:nitroreductase [Hymenobacter endophyticus]|uniref:Putative NAD(P)H nitroreductase n=1 Tax=Hymenobacter endophyticus TaxID=3076335 RepID=A0ABU3TNC9_9BACT|nr:nitroreductase [Hymenobacter endophyticus]MDU0372880.1 nitroreductase [Hymenobacter endophyticus]
MTYSAATTPAAEARQITQLIRGRRSIQPVQFEPGRTIPTELVRELLENATWAPTHKRTEPWYFVVFAGEGRQKLADFQAELYRATAGEKFQESKLDKMRNNPLLSSHIIAIGLKRNPEVPVVEEVAAVACAVQNLHLSAVAHGLAGFWSSGGVTYLPEAKPFFGLGPDDQLLGFFYLGYPKPGASARSTRKPLEEKVTWVLE